MASFSNDISNGLKGFAMGAANVIPGVSGGTIALITGIFGRLIGALNALMSFSTWKLLAGGRFKEFSEKTDARFLIGVGAGIILSIFSLAKLMQYVLANRPVQTWAFFFGMIAASAVVMLYEVKQWKASHFITMALGIGLGVLVFNLSPASTTDDLWFIFVCGGISICTMILPGVSGSFVLLLLGKYEYIMNAISTLNWPVLMVFALGCGIGLAAFSKLLHWLLGRYEQGTMLVLVGFVIGSLVKVWPWSEESLAAAEAASGGEVGNMIIPGIIWIAAGIAAVAALEWMSRRKRNSNL